MREGMRPKRIQGFGKEETVNVSSLAFPRCFHFLFAFFLFMLPMACNVPLYKVAPVPKNITSEAGRTVTVNGLEVTASALLDDNQAFERFEANLPLAGIVVVDIKLLNHANKITNTLQFELQDANGKRFSRLDAKKGLSQVMKFEGVRLYAKLGREETLERLQTITLPKKLKLVAMEERQGVLLFHAKKDVAALQGLVLQVKGTSAPLRIPLN